MVLITDCCSNGILNVWWRTHTCGLPGPIRLLKLGDMEWLTLPVEYSGIVCHNRLFLKDKDLGLVLFPFSSVWWICTVVSEYWLLLFHPKPNRTSVFCLHSCKNFAARPPTHSSCLVTQKALYPAHPHLLLQLLSLLSCSLAVGAGEDLGLLVNMTLPVLQDNYSFSQCLLPVFFSFFFLFLF